MHPLVHGGQCSVETDIWLLQTDLPTAWPMQLRVRSCSLYMVQLQLREGQWKARSFARKGGTTGVVSQRSRNSQPAHTFATCGAVWRSSLAPLPSLRRPACHSLPHPSSSKAACPIAASQAQDSPRVTSELLLLLKTRKTRSLTCHMRR